MVIHLTTTEEDGRRCIQGIDLSSLLEAELPKIHPSKRQRYAIPPLQSSFQNTASDEAAQKIDSQSGKATIQGRQGPTNFTVCQASLAAQSKTERN